MPRLDSTSRSLVALLPLSVALLAVGVGGESSSQPATAPVTLPAPIATRPTAEVPPLDPVVLAKMQALLASLSDPDWRVRDRAAGGLVQLGEPVVAPIERFAATTADDDARLRAAGVLARLEHLRLTGPTRVTLKLQDADVQQAFAELSRQGHVPIRPFRASLFRDRDFPAVTMSPVGVPFWEVMRDLCAREGLKPMADGMDRGEGSLLVLLPDAGKDMSAPHVQAGAFMVGLARLAGRPVDGNPPSADAELMLSVYSDPRWCVLSYPESIQITRVEDIDGRPLPNPEPMIMQGFKEGSPIWTMRTALHLLPPAAKRLRQLSGWFKVRLLEQSDAVEIPNVLNSRGTVRRVPGGHSIQLADITCANQQYTVKVIITRGSLSNQDWRTEFEGRGIRLVDKAGNSLPRIDTQINENGPQITYDLRFISGGKPEGDAAKLIWRLPLESRESTVKFDLNDLPVSGL